jgi:hypothetical protein
MVIRLIIIGAVPGVFGVAQAVNASAATPYRVVDRISAPNARNSFGVLVVAPMKERSPTIRTYKPNTAGAR